MDTNNNVTEVNKEYLTSCIYGCKIRGASHIREEKPCQDACGVWTEEINGRQIAIIAIADGHGGSKYDLSEHGSKLAVNAAYNILKEIYSKANSKNELFNLIRTGFPGTINDDWKKMIESDLKTRENGFLLDERKIAGRYGTTLLFALICEEGIFMGQLGDGNILIVGDDMEVHVPVPDIPNMVGEETFSLSSPDSARLWIFKVWTLEQPTLLMLSTDGLAKGYENEKEFHKLALSLTKNINEFGMNKTKEILPTHLENVSSNGSGDDISLALVKLEPQMFKV